MKDKIIYLIIGVLIGAIITTAIFFIFGNNIFKGSNPGDMPTGENGQMMEKPEGGEGQEPPEGSEGEEPPAKPGEDNKGNSTETNTNSNTNSTTNSNTTI